MRYTGKARYTGKMKYTGQTTYELEICGLKRTLPVIQVAPDLWIASFVILGDTQLVNACAGALASRLSSYDFDVIVGRGQSRSSTSGTFDFAGASEVCCMQEECKGLHAEPCEGGS